MQPTPTMAALIAVFVTIAVPTVAADAQQFRCESPAGKRVDLGNLFNLQGSVLNSIEEGARWDDDGFSNMQPTIEIDEAFMHVTWGNTLPANLIGQIIPKSRLIEIPISHRDDISVAGAIANGRTVEIFRYYFNYNALFRIMSSVALTLQPPETSPAMAAIYVARCEQIH